MAWRNSSVWTGLIVLLTMGLVVMCGLGFRRTPWGWEITMPLLAALLILILGHWWMPRLLRWVLGDRTREFQHDIAAGIVFGFGATILGLATFILAESLLQSNDPWLWFRRTWTSGRLPFLLSAFCFASQTLTKLRKRRFLRKIQPVFSQTLTYGAGISVLCLCFHVPDDLPFVALLSWTVFFTIDEWGLIEELVIYGHSPLPWRHYGMLVAFNFLSNLATLLVMVEFAAWLGHPMQTLWQQLGFGLIGSAWVLSLGLHTAIVLWPYVHRRPMEPTTDEANPASVLDYVM